MIHDFAFPVGKERISRFQDLQFLNLVHEGGVADVHADLTDKRTGFIKGHDVGYDGFPQVLVLIGIQPGGAAPFQRQVIPAHVGKIVGLVLADFRHHQLFELAVVLTGIPEPLHMVAEFRIDAVIIPQDAGVICRDVPAHFLGRCQMLLQIRIQRLLLCGGPGPFPQAPAGTRSPDCIRIR